jgi:hypothetical protein
VLVEVKNAMAIESIIIISDGIGMEPSVELAMGIPDIVLEGGIDIDIDMPGIDMLFILME